MATTGGPWLMAKIESNRQHPDRFVTSRPLLPVFDRFALFCLFSDFSGCLVLEQHPDRFLDFSPGVLLLRNASLPVFAPFGLSVSGQS